MHHIQGPGTISLTDCAQGANRLSVPEHTTSCNAGTQYGSILHRRCASLDLEAAFKQIKIAQNIKPELCTECQNEKCRCPAFMPGMLCSSASSTPTNISSDHEDIPDLVENKPLHLLYPLVQSPSDEEADREVAAICRAPVYYWVRSQLTRRRQYYMYNALDSIGETSGEKLQRANSPRVQGQPVEH